jgi:hypothetical protein
VSATLVNAGNNGWYNPMQDIVYPNYNYTTKTTYSATLITGGNPIVNEEGLTVAEYSGTLDDQYGKAIASKKFKVDKVPVFPSDYRGVSGGGSAYILPMTLQLSVTDLANDISNSSVPVSMLIERNKLYRFFINVTSTKITVNYTVAAWDPVTGSYTDIGNMPVAYKVINISWSNDDWENGGGGNGQEITGS